VAEDVAGEAEESKKCGDCCEGRFLNEYRLHGRLFVTLLCEYHIARNGLKNFDNFFA
jgi:hypothetical protein